MKTIYEHAIGGDGGKGGVYVQEGMLEVKLSYPAAKILEPVLAPLDILKKKIEDLIPGTIGDAAIDAAFLAAKEAIVKMLTA